MKSYAISITRSCKNVDNCGWVFHYSLSLSDRSTVITARLLYWLSAVDTCKWSLIRRTAEKLRSADADNTGSVNAERKQAKTSGKAVGIADNRLWTSTADNGRSELQNMFSQ